MARPIISERKSMDVQKKDMVRMKARMGLLALVSCSALTGCAHYNTVPSFGEVQILKPTELPEYVIQPGDNIDVKLFYSQDLSDNVTVRPDGHISLQLVDDVRAAGLTARQLDEELTQLYAEKLSDQPEVSVIIKAFSDQRVYVAGEVLRSGEFELKNKMTILQAVTAAGGFLDSAKRDAVLVLRQQENNPPQVFLASLTDQNLTEVGKKGTYTLLMPRDIIYVPKSNVAKVDLFMDQYVRDILRFNGFSAGVSGVVELNNKDTVGGNPN